MRRAAVAAVAAVSLGAAGCAAEPPPGSSAPSGSRPGDASAGAREALAGPLSWEFEHIADFHGRFTDIAAVAEDDVWAVGSEHTGASGAGLLHHDGKGWKREPLPEVFADSAGAPRLEVVGPGELWAWSPASSGTLLTWARWDGARWSALPHPPPVRGRPVTGVPDPVAEVAASGPDDVWILASDRSALHWDGARWVTTTLPHPAADIAVAGPDDVWAVGHRGSGPGTESDQGLPYTQPAAMHWDGTSWRSVDTPRYRFPDPLPAEPGASLDGVVALDGGEVRAYGRHDFNHGEGGVEPATERIRLRWDGSRWTELPEPPGGCGPRIPLGRDEDGGLFLDGNWYLTADGRCVKIGRHRLPVSTGAREDSRQSLWLEEIQRVPGTDEWLGAGHVQVNQSGDPFGAPVVVRLKRRG